MGENSINGKQMMPMSVTKVGGARSLVLVRGPHGFGFTLRHFLVYPPDSYRMRAREACNSTISDEPMETIFVKNVPEGSAAKAAGLSTGDRILSVNGETIQGKPYAAVVQLIQNSPDRLHLVVVPKEEDVLQQYYHETAHHPQTNPRPKFRASGVEPIYYAPDPGPEYGSDHSGCRLSLDGGSLSSIESSTLTDDSLILSRRRRICEQKEEFLRSHLMPVFPPLPLESGVAREFYPRPQRLLQPVWPPDISNRSTPLPSDRSNTRSNILRERVTDRGRARSEEKDVSSLRAAPHQLVSRRARQFEAGIMENDRTSLYKSELARLTEKKASPAVAVRKQEFEQLGGSQLPAHTQGSPRRVSTPLSRDLHNTLPLAVDSKRKETMAQWCDTFPPRLVTPTEKQRHKAVRQDSYLAAVKTVPGPTAVRIRRLVRQTALEEVDEDEDVAREEIPRPARGRSASPARFTYRQAVQAGRGPARPTRLNLDSPGSRAVTQTEPETVSAVTLRAKGNLTPEERSMRRMSYLRATAGDQEPVASARRKWLYPIIPGEIERLRRVFEEDSNETPENILRSLHSPDTEEITADSKEACLQCKVVMVEGKRATDRSWKPTVVSLRGSLLTLKRDRDGPDADVLDLRECVVEVPTEYTKRKHVVRIKTAKESEYLLQAEGAAELSQWLLALDQQSTHSSNDSEQESPQVKPRKSNNQGFVSSPKSKTWKGKLGMPFRKIAGSGGSPSSPTSSYPEGATIGIPLEMCPPSPDCPLVPLLVTRCTNVVETRGLDIIGVYRVPGNTAAITSLTEALNRGIHTVPPEDPRWKDVNVISSLMKAFFRSLPDSLFTAELYPRFIEADKLPDQKARFQTLRDLLLLLPEHNYATLQHLLLHLATVVANSAVNKMETKNLAIVFGPTLMRPLDLRALVADTAQQCRILESLISHVIWFFSTDDVSVMQLPQSDKSCAASQESSDTQSGTDLLIGNIAKLESQQSLTRTKNRMSWNRFRSDKTESSGSPTNKSPVLFRTIEDRERPEPGPQTPTTTTLITTETVTEAKRVSTSSLNVTVPHFGGTCPLLGKDSVLPRKTSIQGSSESSLKRFKSSGEDLCLVSSVDPPADNENFETKLHLLKTIDASSDSLDGGSATEKADIESVDEKECKQKMMKSRLDCGINTTDSCTENEDMNEKNDVGKESIEKEESLLELNVLRPRNANATLVKRSESLNKADRPETGPKVRRSESLGKTDGRRADFLLTKTEKTETNMKAKLKRAGVKEKENKRVKRRHTVGGTKDLDKLPWLDNRLKDGRTSSPDLRPEVTGNVQGTPPLESHV